MAMGPHMEVSLSYGLPIKGRTGERVVEVVPTQIVGLFGLYLDTVKVRRLRQEHQCPLWISWWLFRYCRISPHCITIACFRAT
jgi:hypothetical protein